MTLREFYEKNGGDLGEVLQRLPNEAMVRKFIHKFAEDPSYRKMQDALHMGDLKAAFLAVHTLKGIAQNLGFSNLAAAAHRLTEGLRDASGMPQKELVESVDACYAGLMDAIRELD